MNTKNQCSATLRQVAVKATPSALCSPACLLSASLTCASHTIHSLPLSHLNLVLLMVREGILCCGTRPARAGGKVASLCAEPFSWDGLRLQCWLIGLQAAALVLLIVGLAVAGQQFSQCGRSRYYSSSYYDCYDGDDYYSVGRYFTNAFGAPAIVAVGVSLFLLCWLACPCCEPVQQDHAQVEQKALETRIEMEIVARVQAQLQAAAQQIGQQQQQVMVAVPVQSYLPPRCAQRVVEYVPHQQPPAATAISGAFVAGEQLSEQFEHRGSEGMGETESRI